jgi:hypothetical protein
MLSFEFLKQTIDILSSRVIFKEQQRTMNPIIFKVIHLAGAFGVFTALGAILAGANESCRKCASMLHGISLLLLAVAGFGILKNPPMELHYWKIKIVLWLFLGVAPVLARKKVLSTTVIMTLVLGAGIFAAYLGMMQPKW